MIISSNSWLKKKTLLIQAGNNNCNCIKKISQQFPFFHDKDHVEISCENVKEVLDTIAIFSQYFKIMIKLQLAERVFWWSRSRWVNRCSSWHQDRQMPGRVVLPITCLLSVYNTPWHCVSAPEPSHKPLEEGKFLTEIVSTPSVE